MNTTTIIEQAQALATDGKTTEDIFAHLKQGYEKGDGAQVDGFERADDEAELLSIAEQSYILASASSSREVQKESPLSAFQKAIADKDKKALLSPLCIRYLATLKQDEPLQFALTRDTIKETFGKDINQNDLIRAIGQEQRKQAVTERGQKPDVADVATKWASEHQDTWGYDEAGQCWRMWNGTHWEVQADKSSFLDQYAVAALQEAEIAVNSSNVLNLFHRIAASHCRRVFVHSQGKINFLSGTLDVTTMTLISRHQREDNFMYCLPYCYDPHSAHPNMDRYLEETIQYRKADGELVTDHHAVQSYKVHVGLALMGDTLFHQFTLQLGPTRSGKSNLLMLANAVCGALDREEASHFAGASIFSREVEGKRARAEWGNKRMVCVDEVPSEALRDEEALKIMSAHGGIEQRNIGKDEKTANRWKPKLMMSTNDTPHYKDTSGAIKERAIILPCFHGPRPRKEQEKTLFDKKLLPEVGAFAATCITHALAALEQGYYPTSAFMKRTLDRIACGGNPLKAFLQEKCILQSGLKVSRGELYTAYQNYCIMNGNKPLGSGKLQTDLEDMHRGIVYKKIKLHGQSTWGFMGIGLREGDDPTPDDGDEDTSYQDDDLLAVSRLTSVDIVSTKMSTDTSACEATQEALVDKVDNFQDYSSFTDTHTIQSDKGKGVSSYRDGVSPQNRQLCQPQVIEQPVALSQTVDKAVDTMSTVSTAPKCLYPLTIAEDAHPTNKEKYQNNRRVRVVGEKKPGWITVIGKHRLGVVLDGSAFRTDHPVHHVSIVLEQ